jgi:hypothetical protein
MMFRNVLIIPYAQVARVLEDPIVIYAILTKHPRLWTTVASRSKQI